MQKNKKIYLVGTFDTKVKELEFLKQNIEARDLSVCTVDLSARYSSMSEAVSPADICPEHLASFHPDLYPTNKIFCDDRGEAITEIIKAFVSFIKQQDDIAGIIGLGGSGGSALISPGMRILPVGLPKVLVSTVASGNVAGYVGSSDIMMVNSICDIAGLNRIINPILANAANAICGVIDSQIRSGTLYGGVKRGLKTTDSFDHQKPALGLTMFGVTTPCVEALVKEFNRDYDCLVFHATGAGGRAMESLVESDEIVGVLDITTTEIADYIAGGVFSAFSNRLDAIIEKKIPYLGTCGALELINFGTADTIPARFKSRKFYQHNPHVNLLRCDEQENGLIGRFLAEKLNRCEGPVCFLLPEKGMSSLSVEGQVFYDPGVDEVLYRSLEEHFISGPQRKILRVPFAVNDQGFINVAIEEFYSLIKVD